MKKSFILLLVHFFISLSLFSQENQNDSLIVNTPIYHCVNKQSLEVESLFPMFFSGGFHICLGYRFNKLRVRASVINGGSYDAEKAGIHHSADFKRYYKTSPGIFAGYTVWKNLEIYSYLEFHTFEIEQKKTGIKKNLFSIDTGGGIGYQFFVWKDLYIQPAVHIYLRENKSLDFNTEVYKIPNIDFSPVIRIGYRFWKK